MLSYYQCSTFVRGIIPLWVLCITVLFSFVIIKAWQQWRVNIILIPLAFLLIGTDIFRQNLALNIHMIGRREPLRTFGSMPVYFIVGIALLLTFIAVVMIVMLNRWQKNHISIVSIKESIDNLPTGLCYFGNEGYLYMVNRKMMALSRLLTGEYLVNGKAFYDKITGNEIEGVIDRKDKAVFVRLDDGSVYRFKTKDITIDGVCLHEMLAYDVTEQYKEADVLAEKQKELLFINQRLKQYSQTVTEVTREREMLNAKIKIHDNMNFLLMSTRHTVEEPGEVPDETREMLFGLWKRNSFVVNKDVNDSARTDPVDGLKEAAESIGLEFEIAGSMPEDKDRVHIILMAACECMVNASRHAGASKFSMIIGENEVRFTNDGKLPDSEIQEGGGLGNIRKTVEAAGGSIRYELAPRFCLVMKYD